MPRVMLILPTETYRATAFLQAAQELHLDVVVASNEAPTLATLMEGHVLTLDLRHPGESAERAATFASKWPVDAVLGVDEGSVVTAATIAERLQTPRRNPVAAVEATRDKRLLRKVLGGTALVQPQHIEINVDSDVAAIDAAIAVTGLPCVIKPVDLAASRGVIRADDPSGVHAAVRRTGALMREICAGELPAPLLIESYVDGVEIALEGLVRQGFLEVIAIFDKPDPLVGPFFEETLYVTPSRLGAAVQESVIDAVRAAVAALGLQHGPIHAEVRLTGDDAVVIEVASRSIGGLCSRAIRIACGDAPSETRSLENVILREVCGLPLGRMHTVDSASGVFMVPIPRAGILNEVRGVDRAEQVAGITGVAISIPAGHAVRPLPEGDRYLGFVFARGETPAAVEDSLRAAAALIDPDITAPDLVAAGGIHP
jgi:biotin carboxylase